MTAVIMAGGRGTRMAAISADTPKSLMPVDGIPVLTRQLKILHREGVREIIVVCGHLGAQIETFVRKTRLPNITVRCYQESEPLGTAGSLSALGLQEDFLFLNGDLVFDLDLRSMQAFHQRRHALATLFVHPSTHPFDSTLIQTTPDGTITGFLTKDCNRDGVPNLCNAGLMILSPQLLALYPTNGYADMDRDLLIPGVRTKRLYAYKSYEYVKDMGTPARLRETENDLRRSIPALKRKDRLQRAVFLDRDGTLNVHKGHISSPDDLELLPFAAQAVRRINEAGYLAVLATNQPVVARGECSPETLFTIHCRLEKLLGSCGAYLDAIYYCPHHPDRGFPNENRQYKIDCDCRKPKPGMLLQAARDLHIDLHRSYMVGDTATDVQTAVNAGCIPVLLSAESPSAADGIRTYASLMEFAQTI